MLFPGTFYYSVSEKKIFPRNKIDAADSSRSIPNTLIPAGTPFKSLKPVRARTNLRPQPEHPRVCAHLPGLPCAPVPARPGRKELMCPGPPPAEPAPDVSPAQGAALGAVAAAGGGTRGGWAGGCERPGQRLAAGPPPAAPPACPRRSGKRAK